MKKRIKKIVIVLAVLYFLLSLAMYSFQERLIFFPSKIPINHTYQFCQEFEEFNLNAKDGAELNAVHIKQDSAKGIVLYFHGNSGNISNLSHVANLISNKSYDAFLIDYRTYGKSSGKLSEEALKKDAQLFYNHALTKYDEDEIILYGRSFGTGIVAGLAANNKPKKVILESPFYSAVSLGQHRFPILPVALLSNYKFPSNEYVKKIECPIYIFHGTADQVIPYKFAKKLFEVIPEKIEKKMFTIEGGGHKYLEDSNVFKNGINEVFQE